MLGRLALRNTRKSFGDFAVYFLTLTFGVAAFYAFGSVEAQSAMTSLGSLKAENLRTLATTMDVISVVVAIVLAFLVFYANGFLLRRRKREFGTYLVLGMPKRQVAAILLMETMLVGVLALAAGLALGIAGSQGLSLLTAHLFELDMTKYRLIFSGPSLVKTVAFFGLLFATASLLNLFGFSRQTVNRLLNASRRGEAHLRNPWLSALLAIIGLVLVVGACWALLSLGLQRSVDGGQIWVELAAGVAGTFLLYAGGSGLALRVARSSPHSYLRGLNPFVLRQLDNKASSTYATMATVCITLFLAITILSGGISYGKVLNGQTTTAYDASFLRFGSEPHKRSILEGIRANGFDTAKYFGATVEFHLYDAGLSLGDIAGKAALAEGLGSGPLQMISQSDANALLRLQGKRRVDVGSDGFALMFGQFRSEERAVRAHYASATPKVAGRTLRAVPDGLIDTPTSAGSTLLPVLVVPDKIVRGAKVDHTTLNVLYRGDGEAAEQAVNAAGLMDTGHQDPNRRYDVAVTSRILNAGQLAARVTVTYIGLYLGLVLLVTSVAILALQQLSEATENRDRYTTLSKIGASDAMMRRAVFTQVAVYFAAPLGLALVYSLVGGKAILEVIRRVGQVDVATEYGMASVILVVVFVGYFTTTVLAARRIALEKPRGRHV